MLCGDITSIKKGMMLGKGISILSQKEEEEEVKQQMNK